MGIRMKFAQACVRVWTWLYTYGLPYDERVRRCKEIESDLWEFEADRRATQPAVSAIHLLLRLVLGIPDDIGWRVRQASVSGTRTDRTVVLAGRAAGAAVFLCALWIIDADSARRRVVTPIPIQPSIVVQQNEGGVAMHARRAVRRTVPVLMAGIAAAIAPPQLAARSQLGGPAFEVASVRPNTSDYRGMRLEPQPGGRLTGTNVTAGMLIRFAYDLPDFLVFGEPSWLNSDRFDLAAKAENDAPVNQLRLMLRQLLMERFKLTAHTETRELPIYALVTARNDGRFGPQLRRSNANCPSTASSATEIGPSPPGGPPACGFFGFSPDTKFSEGRGGLAFRGLTMPALAKRFVPILRRSVRDSTGLDGHFDADFDFISELPLPPPPPGLPNPFDAPFGSVFTVLPQQLGLKLESTKGRVDVLVIDAVDKPAPE
jgi:uncharacterized protein (TIGR03435 family)